MSCGNREYPGYSEAKSGLIYKIHQDNKMPKAQPGDYLTVEMTYLTNEDSLLFDAKGQTFPMQLEKPVFAGDINEALAMMGVGDSTTFVIRADSFLLKNAKVLQLPTFVNANSKVIFHVKLHNIQTLEELQKEEEQMIENARNNEVLMIQQYLADNNLSAQPTETGLYFIRTVSGKGPQAHKGKKVVVHYTGKFLNGQKFDSSLDRNRPVEFTLGQGEVIGGWDEGITMMNVGDEVLLIFPSPLGYGEGRGDIPPFTPLLFEVKLINIK
jgi:FKBP-type peptidyl-prolyl cis-trans isomerase